MILKLEVAKTPPQLVGCHQYLCRECIWKEKDKPECDGKRAYREFLNLFHIVKALKEVKNGSETHLRQ
jgi:hypothetical protein